MRGGGPIGVARVIEELVRINNEQANALRAAAKSLALAAREKPRADDELLDDLSRVNNELATLQRELARKNAQLVRLNQQKNRLLGMAAHDLRSPLGVVQSYAEFLRDEAAAVLDDEQREFVEAIWDSSRFMLSIIDDLLDVAQIEAGTLNLELAETDLVELVQRNVVLNRVLASRKNIRLELSVPDEPVLVPVDPRKIQQVLNNLLSNAIKYSHPDSTAWIELEAALDTVRITVRDEGEGIAEKDIPGLFQPFGRASKQGTSGERSTGLGLAIVHRIIEGHGGHVGLESAPGKGSTFSVILPWRSEA